MHPAPASPAPGPDRGPGSRPAGLPAGLPVGLIDWEDWLALDAGEGEAPPADGEEYLDPEGCEVPWDEDLAAIEAETDRVMAERAADAAFLARPGTAELAGAVLADEARRRGPRGPELPGSAERVPGVSSGPAGGFGAGGCLDVAPGSAALHGFVERAVDSGRLAEASGDEVVGLIAAADRAEASACSLKHAAVAELLRRRAAPGAKVLEGTAGVPEAYLDSAAAEVKWALAETRQAADQMLGLAWDLAVKLPGTRALFRAGRLRHSKVVIIARQTAALRADGLRADGLRADGRNVVLRVIAAERAGETQTEVAALTHVARVAQAGLPVPELLGYDLAEQTGYALLLTGQVAGSGVIPAEPDPERLRALGAVAARISSVTLSPARALPVRYRPIEAEDFARLRREQGASDLLRAAEAAVAMADVAAMTGAGVAGAPVAGAGPDHGQAGPDDHRVGLVHGDLWYGNTLWDEDGRLTAIIDWDCAGVGPAGIDLGTLRCDAAWCHGLAAADDILRGWEAEAGRPGRDVPYWDVVASLSSPPDMGWFPESMAAQGRPDLTREVMLERRDAFLAAALSQLEAVG